MTEAKARIFVFGSNLAGRHGAGAARRATVAYGAIYGQGYGLQGRSFAIPTKSGRLETLPLPIIERYVGQFLLYACTDRLEFNVTQIGCGLAGLEPGDMAPMFKPRNNIWYDRAWEQHLVGPGWQFWTDEAEVL